MIKNRFFKKHYARLVVEGVIRAVLWGLLIGFAANFLAAVAAWFIDLGGIWFAIGVGAGAAVASGVALYFIRFCPKTEDVARRVDRLGLEERMITMLELQDDDSYLAKLQRENAKTHLEQAEGRKLRFRISKALTALTVAAAVIGAGMTTVVGLAEQDILPSGSEIVNPEDPMANHIAISYVVEEGGEIEGEADQLLLAGSDTTPVVAVANDGWVFVGWDDGGENPERQETNVTEEMVFTAIFEEILDSDGEGEGESDGNGQPGDAEGDKADDVPGGGEANAESDQQGGNGDKGDASGADGNSDGGQGSSQEEGEGKGEGKGQGAGGKWEDSNQFIDGNTYYRDYLDVYYQMALEIFEANGEIPPEMKEFFETYFNSI